MEYKTGDTVKHRVFGSGVVLAVMADSVKVKFGALATARNIRRDFLGLKVWPRGNYEK